MATRNPTLPRSRREPGADAACALECVCGKLLARWVDGEIEIRCQRCKRNVRIVVEPEGGTRVRGDA
jgi:phage FluMu protein Com